jgi:MATE family multidrug resistance protein
MKRSQLNRDIMAIALPAIISNITTPLLGLIDTSIVGHIGSAAYIGAIAIGSAIFNMIYWLLGFLRMGSSGLTAQAYGANDSRRISLIIARAIIIALSTSAVIILASSPIAHIMLRFMGADTTTTLLARKYFSICIFGAPAVLSTFAVSGWFLGLQDSKTPMIIALITNISNIIISLVLVVVFDLKLVGVALGTVLSQWIAFGYAAYHILSHGMIDFKQISRRALFNKAELTKLFRLNSDIFLRTLCLVMVTLWFTHAGASQEVNTLAANTILMQLFMLFSYFIDGFAYAGEAIAGKYYGRNELNSLNRLVNMLLKIGGIMSLCFSAIYLIGGDIIMHILTNNTDVIATAHDFLPWAACTPLLGFMAFTYDGIFIGLTWTRRMLYTMLASMLAFFTSYFALYSTFGNHALWLSFCLYITSRSLIQHLIYHRATV